MTPYILLFVPLLLFGFLNLTKEFNTNRINGLVLFVYSVILVLFSGLRYNTGFDFYDYERILRTIDIRAIFNTSIEPGYVILNKFVHKYFNNYNFLLLILSTICILFIVKFIKIYSPYKIMSLYFYSTIYFIGGITGQMRQAVAISVLTMCFQYIEKRNFKGFMFWVVVACSFHLTSSIFIILYFLYPLNLNKKRILLFSCLALLIGIGDIFDYLVPILDKFFNFFIVDSVIRYSQSRHAFNLFLSAGFLERIFVMGLIFVYYDHLVEKYERSKLVIWSYLVNSGVYFIFINHSIFARRLSSPFKIVDILLLTMIIGVQKNKYFRVILFMVLSTLFIANLYATLNNPSGRYLPYEFIF